MAYKSYPKPKPLSPEEQAWFENLIRLQANTQLSVDKPKKQAGNKEK